MQLTNVNRQKIVQEFADVGVQIDKVEAIDGNGEIGANIIFVDGTDMELVQSIIDAHDATPIPSAPTDAERIAVLEDTINFLLGL